MAKYCTENGEFIVDLTGYTWVLGDDCDGVISVYPRLNDYPVDLEEVFIEEKGLLEEVYRYLNLYYEGTDILSFKSLWLELDGVDYSEISCTKEEINMFTKVLEDLC